MATTNPKTLSSNNTCVCSGTSHGSRSSSSTCSRCSSRPRSPPSAPDCPAIGDHNKNDFLHFGPGYSGGTANNTDLLAQEINAEWEGGEKLAHRMKHEVPKVPKMD
ncbi:hypothetical protein F53441_13871 [Fusarium austroafricanum]|uniref:Uncharacterized protein n=1 Tax=Fusarium austroafricanum TaxID=2364996 RepID=A0A8H4JND8_9HYPO|nr:hypothetical protein F53441_13871 [Fusarium austroafricanum]